MWKYLIGTVRATGWVGWLLAVSAASAQNPADSLVQDQQQIIEAIAPYAAEVRSNILEAAQYPQVLVKLERTQARSSQSFQDLVKPYPQATQAQFYELSRYPALVDQLIANGNPPGKPVQPLVASYPKEIQQAVTALYPQHFDDLTRMNNLYQSSQQALDQLLQPYPKATQNALRQVVDKPEVMTLLTDHIDLTISLGEAYASDPTGVSQELDSLHAALSAQSAQDLAAFKQQVADDPALQAEMKKAADEFAKNNGDATGNPTIVNNYYTTNYNPPPYPYWFGYPYWQPAPVWYPRPLYFDTGFYFGPGGRIVVVGLPSAAYAGWFFSFGRTHYPHLYRQYNTYYNVHRANITNVNIYRGFNHTVNNHFGNGRPDPDFGRWGANRGHSPDHAASRGPEPAPAHATPSAPHFGPEPAHGDPFRFHGNAEANANRYPANPGFHQPSFDALHANDFHRQGWANMGGIRIGLGMRGGRR